MTLIKLLIAVVLGEDIFFRKNFDKFLGLYTPYLERGVYYTVNGTA